VLVASWVYLLFEGYSDKMGLEKDDLTYKVRAAPCRHLVPPYIFHRAY
jgi:hypothetical protein